MVSSVTHAVNFVVASVVILADSLHIVHSTFLCPLLTNSSSGSNEADVVCRTSALYRIGCQIHCSLGVVLLQQVALPVPLAIGEHFRQANPLEVLDALLQILLQHLLLLLFLVQNGRGAPVLLGSGAWQCFQIQGGGSLGALKKRWWCQGRRGRGGPKFGMWRN